VTSGIFRQTFDVVGLSSICSSYPLTLRLTQEIRRANPQAKIILGGPQASLAGLLLHLCDGQHTVSDITQALSSLETGLAEISPGKVCLLAVLK
jgi:hypothetical protein